MDPSTGPMGPDVAQSMAMLDTRAFWEERPETHSSWHPILRAYQDGNSRFPPFPLLTHEKIHSHTKDSAPGLDGVPYAAWRFNAQASTQAIHSFLNILQAQEKPRARTCLDP